MKARKILISSSIAAVTLAGSLLMSSPAIAGQSSPTGSCGDSYTLATDKQMAKILVESTLADVQANWDKNGDGYVCYKPLPQNKNDPTPPYNVIDDNKSA